MPEFRAGFAALADRLTEAVVGLPVEDEWRLAPNIALQTTTRGLMWYIDGGQAMFLPAIAPRG